MMAAPPSFPVRPTPDDGVRLSADRMLDESDPTDRPAAANPTGPTPRPSWPPAQHLVDIHDHLRAELSQIRAAGRPGHRGVGRAAAPGSRSTPWPCARTAGRSARTAPVLLPASPPTTLSRTRLCFPGCAGPTTASGPVLDRLGEEHRIIHDVLGRLDAALLDLVADPVGDEPLRAAVDQLSDALLSHLAYEERELVEPLARAHLFG